MTTQHQYCQSTQPVHTVVLSLGHRPVVLFLVFLLLHARLLLIVSLLLPSVPSDQPVLIIFVHAYNAWCVVNCRSCLILQVPWYEPCM